MIRGNGVGTNYGYDPVSRLNCTITHMSGGGVPDCTPAATGNDRAMTLAYNPASQITSYKQGNDTYAWTSAYNVDRLYSTNGLNQYSASGGVSLGYDARGNLTQSGTTTFSYDATNHLTGSNVGTNYLEYGSLDELQGLGTTFGSAPRFASDGGNIIGEYLWGGSPSLQRRYVYAPGVDEPIVWYEGTGTADRRFLIADERGSIVAVTDSAANAIAINRYDEFGIPASTNVGRFQYTGQAWIPELGMYYYKARMYSPTLGRFMQTDPIGYGDGLNWYNYAHSDPVNGSDPSGKAEDCALIFYESGTAAAGVNGAYVGATISKQVCYFSFGNEPRISSGEGGGGGGGGRNDKPAEPPQSENKGCGQGLAATIADYADKTSVATGALAVTAGVAGLLAAPTGAGFAGLEIVAVASGTVSLVASGVGVVAHLANSDYVGAGLDAVGLFAGPLAKGLGGEALASGRMFGNLSANQARQASLIGNGAGTAAGAAGSLYNCQSK